jgi:transposase InsO family protein
MQLLLGGYFYKCAHLLAARSRGWLVRGHRADDFAFLAESMSHYNGERPHSALGPGLPDDPSRKTTLTGHRLSAAHHVVASTRLGGLHHHYQLETVAA